MALPFLSDIEQKITDARDAAQRILKQPQNFIQGFKPSAINTLNTITKAVSSYLPQYAPQTQQVKPQPLSAIRKQAENYLNAGLTTAQNYGNYLKTEGKRLTSPEFFKPKFTFADEIKNPVLNFAAQIPQSILNAPINTGEGLVNLPRSKSPQQVISNAAKIADLPLTLATFGAGGTALNIGKQGLKSSILKGGLEGLKYGAAYGGLSGLREGENLNLEEQLRIGAERAVLGGVGGAVVGGVVPLVGYGIDRGGKFVVKIMGDEKGFVKIPGKKPPILAKAIEDAINGDDLAKAQDIIDKLPDKNPYKAPFQSTLNAHIKNQSTAGKYSYNINLDRLKLSPKEKKVFDTRISTAKNILEKAKGQKLTDEEVINAAKTSEILQNVTSREDTVRANAAMLRARQNMVELDKNLDVYIKKGNVLKARTTMADLVDSLRVVSSEAADRGRKLQSLSIEAGDESLRSQVLRSIARVENDSNRIAKEALKVNWNNANSITTFYRQFVKPSTGEILDEFRYNNILSNPLTHERNAFSNLIQTFISRPLTLVVQGDISGAGRYYKGAFGSFPDAIKAFQDSFLGKGLIQKPDLSRLSTKKIPGALTIPTRAMEASDRFFQTIISSGERARGVSSKEAEKIAQYSLFRSILDPSNRTGQGVLLSKIDNATLGIYQLGEKVPGLRWFVPFLQTPMNVAKQWLEYSPGGFATIPGAAKPKEQIAKAVIGSVITAMGGWLASQDKTTWSAPVDPKAKELFYASGRKPFSIKVGDAWVPMPFLGVYAFPVALAAAAKYYQDESRTALTDSQIERLTKGVFSMTEFFSQQTFMEGLGNFVSLVKGDKDYSLPANLAFTAQQIIPLNGLVGYISRILDPIFRKADGEGIGGKFIAGVQRNIPFLSSGLPAYTNPLGEESRRNISSYLAPYALGVQDKRFEQQYQGREILLQSNDVLNKIDDAIVNGRVPTGDPALVEFRQAEYYYKKILNREASVDDLISQDKITKGLAEKILIIRNLDKNLKISSQDRMLPFFEPKIKAERILQRLQDFESGKGKKEYLEKLIRNKIIDPETARLILEQTPQ